MARADLMLSLAKAGSSGDRHLFTKTLEALAAEERKKRHHILAERLEEILADRRSLNSNGPSPQDDRILDLLAEVHPRRTLASLILSDQVMQACSELIEEQQRSELLRSHNIEPRNRILLIGPPGNGKSSLAEAIAENLMVPLHVVRYEAVIGSYLGETANRLRRVFDHMRTRHAVLLLDEFDTLAKERGDEHETGEIKRVVSSLLLQLDDLPSHVVVITATNHPELLDRAVWRRFQLRLTLPPPTRGQIVNWFEQFESLQGRALGYAPRTLADRLKGSTFSELEDFTTDVLRRNILNGTDTNLKNEIASRLNQWKVIRQTTLSGRGSADA